MNEQVTMVPIPGGIELETTVFRPDGDGPFPLAVINHGKRPGDPRFQERARYLYASREFVRRGYAVALPMRAGFSRSGGSYVSPGCDIASDGELQAARVNGVIEWFRRQPFIDRERIVVLGQSYGGLATLALGARNPDGVRGVVNFAGGLRVDDCGWRVSLSDAFARYGARSRLPSLWFYGDNDSYFPPDLWRDLNDRYREAGGRVRLIAFGRFGLDAHGMFGTRDGLRIWVKKVERFLEALGLPYRPTVSVSEVLGPPSSGFAELEDVAALPYLHESGRSGYLAFLRNGLPRAFAVGPSGTWGWASAGGDPAARALAHCQKYGSADCRLYAVDDAVVWQP